MWKMVYGSSENDNKPRNEEPLVEETSRAEKRAHFAAGSQTKSSCKHIPGIGKHYLLPFASGLCYEPWVG
ncbi:hypothetical protein ABFA07_013351 [Porites harrisoni]